MKKNINVLTNPMWYIMAILSVIRVILGVKLGIWFPAGQVWDDRLMVVYATLSEHFSKPEYYSLLKDMSFPVFLRLSAYIHIPYAAILGILWIMAALFVFSLVYRLSGKKWISFAFYIYVLFFPQAFEVWIGTRFYRNAIIGPFVIVTLVLMIKLVINAICPGKGWLRDLILLGLFFSFTYYIKEDGIWLIVCLLFAMIVSFICIVLKRKEIIRKALLICIPLCLFALSTLGYKAVNLKCFGVFEINTRTEGELAKFYENCYKVETQSGNQNVWLPMEAMEKVFAASKTLASYPEVFQDFATSLWAEGDNYANPLKGDISAWAFRESLYYTGNFTSEKDVQILFKQVNEELDEAFKNGTLKKSNKLQILPSTIGYSREEIKKVIEYGFEGLKGAVLLKGYNFSIPTMSEEEIVENLEIVDRAVVYTNTPYLEDYSEQSRISASIVPIIVSISKVYRILNPVLFVLTVLIIIFELAKVIINVCRRRTNKLRRKSLWYSFAAFVFLGVGFIFSFAISWFSAFTFSDGFNMTILNFYNAALPGILMFAYFFALMCGKSELE